MTSDAVIFIPGIKGTKLVETNRSTWDTVWSGIQYNFESIESLELTSPDKKGRFYEENPMSIIRPGEIEALAYGEFLSDLDTDKPVYIFNYDWRLSASENGRLLKGFMDYLVGKSTASSSFKNPIKKFDFITHSLGNAVLRNMLQREKDEKGRDEIFSMVNKIVFTVPPFKGSLDIVVTALIGEGFFKGVKSNIRKLIRMMPGALELLPSYDGASYYPQNGAHDFFDFTQWQSNVRDDDSSVSKKMNNALQIAKKTIETGLLDFADLTHEERDRILILVRDGFDTWQSVPVIRNSDGIENLVDFGNGIRTSDGDGRVPHRSSCVYSDSIQTLIFEDSLWFKEFDHGFFLKDERVQKIVNRFLFGEGDFNYKIPGSSVRKL